MTSQQPNFPILVLGSAGAFGSKIVALLTRGSDFDLVLAGRNRQTLEGQASALARLTSGRVRTAVLDANTVTADDLSRLGVALVVNASGPYQGGHYGLARAAIDASCHYVDLADGRAFVTGIDQLDDAARAAGVLVVSGASSVPGVSSAVVAHHRDQFRVLEAIDIAISPGNSFDPGVATVASVLSGVGKPMKMLLSGTWQTVHGWQGLRRQSFGEAGGRWVGYVDVPDLDLFPAHEAGLRTARFKAGLEVSFFHLGTWAASWLTRSGFVTSLAPLAPQMLAIKRLFHRFGSDRGGMVVEMHGLGHDGKPKSLQWLMVARSGDGPNVPALASVALTRRLASGTEARRGAMPCYALARLDEILAEAQGLDIICTTNEIPLPSSDGRGF